MSVDEVLREVAAVVDEAGHTANLPSLPVVDRDAHPTELDFKLPGEPQTVAESQCRAVAIADNSTTFSGGRCCLPLCAAGACKPGFSEPAWVLLGTGTDKGIFRAAWNAERGELSNLEVAAAAVHPSYLAMHPTLPIVYAVNESSDRERCAVELSAGSRERWVDAGGASEQRREWALLCVGGPDGQGCVCCELWRWKLCRFFAEEMGVQCMPRGFSAARTIRRVALPARIR